MKGWQKRSAEIRHARDAAASARDVPSAYAALPEPAKTLKRVLEERSAFSTERAIPDSELAKLIGCPVRNVIEHAEALTTIDVAVLAGGVGRYISHEPKAIRAYADGLHARAKAVHMRAKSYRNVAARLEEKQLVAQGGQWRFAL